MVNVGQYFELKETLLQASIKKLKRLRRLVVITMPQHHLNKKKIKNKLEYMLILNRPLLSFFAQSLTTTWHIIQTLCGNDKTQPINLFNI